MAPAQESKEFSFIDLSLSTIDVLTQILLPHETPPTKLLDSLPSNLKAPFPFQRSVVSWFRRHAHAQNSIPPCSKLCALHRKLNGQIIRLIFDTLALEIGSRLSNLIADYPHPSDRTKSAIITLQDLHALWLLPRQFEAVFLRTPTHEPPCPWQYQSVACDACILAAIPGHTPTLIALRAAIVSRGKKRNQRPAFLSWLDSWVAWAPVTSDNRNAADSAQLRAQSDDLACVMRLDRTRARARRLERQKNDPRPGPQAIMIKQQGHKNHQDSHRDIQHTPRHHPPLPPPKPVERKAARPKGADHRKALRPLPQLRQKNQQHYNEAALPQIPENFAPPVERPQHLPNNQQKGYHPHSFRARAARAQANAQPQPSSIYATQPGGASRTPTSTTATTASSSLQLTDAIAARAARPKHTTAIHASLNGRYPGSANARARPQSRSGQRQRGGRYARREGDIAMLAEEYVAEVVRGREGPEGAHDADEEEEGWVDVEGCADGSGGGRVGERGKGKDKVRECSRGGGLGRKVGSGESSGSARRVTNWQMFL